MSALSSSRPPDISSKSIRRPAVAGVLTVCLLLGTGGFLFRQRTSMADARPAPSAQGPEDLPRGAASVRSGQETSARQERPPLEGPQQAGLPATAFPDAPPVRDSRVPVGQVPDPVKTMKVGTVDMAVIFRDYHKTREAERRLNEDKTKAKKELEARRDRQQEVGSQLTELGKVLADRLVNEELKRQTHAKAEALQQEYRRLTAGLEEFAGRRQRQLLDQSERLRRALLDEVASHIREMTKRDGYDLVFDKSSQGISGSPLLLVTREAMDLTAEVILSLNRQAPVAKALPAPD